MSHFTVMVIGDNPEEQLAPYDENIEVPTYTDENGNRTNYNPKSKWDWYLLGGRWTGFLRLKPEGVGFVGTPGVLTKSAKAGYADSARIDDIDLEAMRAEAEMRMRKTLAKIAGIPRDWLSWEEMEKKFPGDFDACGKAYWAQQNAKAVSDRLDMLLRLPDKYLNSDEELIAAARKNALQTFAVVKDGEWYERGEMGWFACWENEKSSEVWSVEFEKLINGLPPGTLISIYDCHI